jgi:hypothetical protein
MKVGIVGCGFVGAAAAIFLPRLIGGKGVLTTYPPRLNQEESTALRANCSSST